MEFWDSEGETYEDGNSDLNENDKNTAIKNMFLVLLLKIQVLYRLSDRAVTAFLSFLVFCFIIIGSYFQVDAIVLFAKSIPISLQAVYNAINFSKDNFVKYVVCPKCNTLYTYEEAVINTCSGRRTV